MALLRKQLSTTSFRSTRTTNLHYPKHSSLPPGSITEFVWKDYSPTIFRFLIRLIFSLTVSLNSDNLSLIFCHMLNIQELGNVNYEDYMLSVCNHETLLELAFRGCCGKPFFMSHDDRFVIKTLRKSEAMVLLEMLPSYYGHLQKHENSLLTKYYGLHASRPGNGGAKVYFVVMENLLRTDMQLQKRYDLKGSSQGRTATKNGSQQKLTLKDLEFDLCFYLDHSIRCQILEQIKLDCKFLEETGIMDYSLLLGIHVENPRRGSSRRRSPDDSMPDDSVVQVQNKADRLMLQDSEQEFLHEQGKCFRNYNVIKRIEHAYKSLQYDSKTISSVNPKLYASRFQEFLSKVFLEDESDSIQSEGLDPQSTTMSYQF
ncbi:Phosphatidylinositol 4-phosphate 5-kinase 9 [Bienertia sinuspersici]